MPVKTPMLLAILLCCPGLPTHVAAADAQFSCLAPQPPPDEVWIAAGRFVMGSDHAYPEEAPAHNVEVAGFWIDRHEVTNTQFAAFVAATGYLTLAERGLSADEYPGLPAAMYVPGSMVFVPPANPAADAMQWWQFVPGALWRHPEGEGSTIIRWCISRWKTRRLMHNGRGAGCQPRPNLNMPRVPEAQMIFRGVGTCTSTGKQWPIPGKDSFHSMKTEPMGIPAWHPWAVIRPINMVFTT